MFDNFHMGPIEDDADVMPLFSITDGDEENDQELVLPDELPALALKNTILFPGIVIPITVGRDKSIKAVNKAYEGDKLIAVCAQRDPEIEDPEQADLFPVGTLARIVKILKMPDGSITAILQGKRRFKLLELLTDQSFLVGKIEILNDITPDNKMEFDAILLSIRDSAKKIIELSPNIPSDAVVMLKNISSPRFLINFMASNLSSNMKDKQEILEMDNLQDKAQAVFGKMDGELQLLEIKGQIESKVRVDIEKQQRDYFLNQQLKTIQEELGSNPQEAQINELILRSKDKKWDERVAKVFQKEIEKLKRTNPQVADYSVTLNYVENLLELPWNEYSEDNFNLKNVKEVLDKDHFGLDDVKDRIIEHLAVLKLKGDMKSPIICLVGPPGVGKTSLGKSIANALERKFIRMSLGGLHDESEIRGHRKTYIGAMPGRIIKSIKKVKTSNPVFILDEIDKVVKDFRGDPSSALLEVLDPEQNETFHDNYLDIEYDLSKVLFIATANSLSSIQPALLDRMEIIQVSGYSTEEKVEIAKLHLIPDQKKNHGLRKGDYKMSNKVITHIIQNYTKESGVRSLNRQIAGVSRGIAKKVAMEETYEANIAVEEIKALLGPTKYKSNIHEEKQVPGVAVGLAWTSVGGDILYIEASKHKGKGKLTLTGNLGDVMKESATTAMTFIKSRAEALGIDQTIFEENDFHIHVPEGAIPKDGPSAGITMLSALTSIMRDKPLKQNLAMTGEITLRGKVLPVGGIKEKVLAAKRAGIKTIILCKDNQKNIEKINERYIKGLKFIYVERMEEVLTAAIG